MTVFDFGHCTLDLGRHQVIWPHKTLPLTVLEAQLLRYLADRHGQTVTLEALLRDVWGYAANVESRAPAHAILRVRRKIEVDASKPAILCNVFGAGYSMTLPATDPGCARSPEVQRVLEMAYHLDGEDPMGNTRFVAAHHAGLRAHAEAHPADAPALFTRMLAAAERQPIELDMDSVLDCLGRCEGGEHARLLGASLARIAHRGSAEQALAMAEAYANTIEAEPARSGHLAFRIAHIGLLFTACRNEEASALATRGIADARGLCLRFELAVLLERSATLAAMAGDHLVAMEMYREAVEVFRALGARHNEARTSHNWANRRWLRCDEGALEAYQHAAQVFADLGDVVMADKVRVNLAHAHLCANQPEIALGLCEDAVGAAQRVGDHDLHLRATLTLGRAKLLLGRYEQASVALGQAIYIAGSRRGPRISILAHMSLGWLALRTGARAEARQQFRLAMSQSPSSFRVFVTLVWMGLAYPPQHATRRRLWRQAERVVEGGRHGSGIDAWLAGTTATPNSSLARRLTMILADSRPWERSGGETP